MLFEVLHKVNSQATSWTCIVVSSLTLHSSLVLRYTRIPGFESDSTC